ncbi:MAG: hypothetical protein P8I55_06140 [Crocinitomix sp.]|nr:hypothetical protein [Crocinitomix sp.]
MNIKQYLICFITTGIFFGCVEQIDTPENFPPPNFAEEEILSCEISDLIIYEIQTQLNYDKVLAISDSLNKPVLLYFTGYTSVNSRKFENSVWPDPKVYDLLNDQFIIAQMYVDI